MTSELSLDAKSPGAAEAAREIGREIRRLRKARHLTLADLAARTGVSVSMLSMLERGLAGASIGTLVAVAAALGVSLGEMFSDRAPSRSTVIRRDEQPIVNLNGGVSRRTVHRDPDRGIEVAVLELPKKAHTGDDPVRHDGHEYLSVLDGALTVYIANKRFDLQRGDALALDAGQPHRFVNAAATVTRVHLVQMTQAVPPVPPH